MKLNTITIAISLFLAALCLPAQAQSVKDIISDKTGQYIYSQARDEDSQSALGLASDELTSRVEAYLGANKMKKYNQNWKEWVKRIINEKYGRTRVFLYLSVDDLKPEAEALTAPKQDYIGGSSSVEKTKKDDKKSQKEIKVAETPVENVESTVKEQVEKAPEEVITTEVVETVIQEEPTETVTQEGPTETVTQEGPTETEESLATPESAEEVYQSSPLPDGLLGDVIIRIFNEGVNGDIPSQLSRGKNMKVIGMYGNDNSKYLPHAYIITNDNGKLRIFTPQNKEGMRTDLTDGASVKTITGKMMYWFLKK